MLLKVLTVLTMASVTLAATDLASLAESEPTDNQFLVYDIRGDVSQDDVKGGFSGFNTPYMFRSLSGQRYIVVLKMDAINYTAYTNLAFPASSQVDMYPAELISDLFGYYGVEGILDKEVISLATGKLVMTEYIFKGEGLDGVQYKVVMRKLGMKHVDFLNNNPSRVFHLTGRIPFQCFGFVSLSPAQYDRVLVEGAKLVGGPYQPTIRITPVTVM